MKQLTFLIAMALTMAACGNKSQQTAGGAEAADSLAAELGVTAEEAAGDKLVADSMFTWCGLRTTTPPMPVYYAEGGRAVMPYTMSPDPWAALEDPDDEPFGDVESFLVWRVQEQMRRTAALYTQALAEDLKSPVAVAFSGEVKCDAKGIVEAVYVGPGTPTPGLTYAFKGEAPLPPMEGRTLWLFTDEYLKTRKRIDPADAVARLTQVQKGQLNECRIALAFEGPDGLELLYEYQGTDYFMMGYAVQGDGRHVDPAGMPVNEGELRTFDFTPYTLKTGLSAVGASPREGITFSVRPVKDDAGMIQAVSVTMTLPSGKTAEDLAYVGQDQVSDMRIAPADYWGEVEETDIDFDGTRDLTVTIGTFREKQGAPKTIRVVAWRWDTDRNCFDQVDNFPWNPALDEDGRRILCRRAMYDGSQDYVPYYWRGGQLLPDYDGRWNSRAKTDDPFPLPAECLYSE